MVTTVFVAIAAATSVRESVTLDDYIYIYVKLHKYYYDIL